VNVLRETLLDSECWSDTNNLPDNATSAIMVARKKNIVLQKMDLQACRNALRRLGLLAKGPVATLRRALFPRLDDSGEVVTSISTTAGATSSVYGTSGLQNSNSQFYK
jgi:hypothetical protein